MYTSQQLKRRSAICFLAFVALLVSLCSADNVYTFRPPFIEHAIAHWDYGGSTTVDDSYIRLTQALESRAGWLFSREPFEYHAWAAVLEYKVGGPRSPGADGMALWYVQHPAQGTVFGGSEKYTGLGIFFDTFDNDGRQNNPSIYAVLNDGTHPFDHRHDGGSRVLGQCTAEYRNTQHPIKTKIIYMNRSIMVYFDLSNSEHWQPCFLAADIDLTTGYYWGMTAATGYYSDNHEVMSFSVLPIEDQEFDTEYQNLDEGHVDEVTSEPPIEETPVDERSVEQPESRQQPPQPPPQNQTPQTQPVAPPPPPPPQHHQQTQQVPPHHAETKGPDDLKALFTSIEGLRARAEVLAASSGPLTFSAMEKMNGAVAQQGTELKRIRHQVDTIRSAADGISNLIVAINKQSEDLRTLSGQHEVLKQFIRNIWIDDVHELNNHVKETAVDFSRVKTHFETSFHRQETMMAGLPERVVGAVLENKTGNHWIFIIVLVWIACMGVLYAFFQKKKPEPQRGKMV
mmetsp:Transcript_37493/g.62172  ORF Transcript_37493/g.62172 Transcript_37493/m.62172 type:complete len:513 (+) Transcript_37493:119-1657(+)